MAISPLLEHTPETPERPHAPDAVGLLASRRSAPANLALWGRAADPPWGRVLMDPAPWGRVLVDHD
jgi:hypothetical protein